MKRVFFFISLILPFLFVFIASIYQPSDPDLGWHLKYGEYFFQHGSILNNNTFASDMPNYHWVNLSWGVDLLYYLFYFLGGFWGLTLASAAVVTLTCYFFAKAFELDYFQKAIIFPILVYLEQPVVEVSFRGQLVSIFLLSILTYFLFSFERGKKKILYLIPLLFLIWANLHGQFVIGLGIFGLWIAATIFRNIFTRSTRIVQTIRERKDIIMTFIASVLATLLNPYFFGIYQETARYSSNPLLKDITEYLPPDQLSSIWWNHILVGFIVSTGIVIYYFKGQLHENLSKLSIFSVLYILSFFVKRYSWMMYYFIIPFIKPFADFLKPESKKAQFWGGTVIFIIAIGITLLLKSPWQQYTSMSWDIYCKKYQGCSPQAAEYLKTIQNKGNLMNLYGWGGWLIWNYPDIKPSIDGRMHLWKDEHGNSAFESYYAYEQNMRDVDASSYDTVLMLRSKPVYRRLLELSRLGKWKLVYEDRTTAIFVRVNNPS